MQDGMTKVTVIIPVFNAAETLSKCLDSVLRQTLDGIEIICVDDCSSDNSIEILDQYRLQHTNILVIALEQNSGSGNARNIGLSMAHGTFVAFMDADDFYNHKDVLNNLYTSAVSNGAKVCGGGIRFFCDDANRTIPDASDYQFKTAGWIDFEDYQQFYYYQRFIFDRTMLVKAGITFPNYLRFQDPPFFVRAMIAAKRFYALPIIVYAYRHESKHVQWTQAKVNDMMKGTLDVLSLCDEHGYTELAYNLLKKHIEEQYMRSILASSLVRGNDNVVLFYQKLLKYYDVLLQTKGIRLNTDYAETISHFNFQRNISYHHRPIDLVDKQGLPQPDVTVIVPVYNVGAMVRETIDSLLRQTLNDIEIICIDDGSTDDSPTILDSYELADHRVKVYHQSNQGLSAARNEGLRHASGRYILFCDGDDLLVEDALETLVHQADANDLQVTYYGGETFFEQETMSNREHFISIYSRDGQYPVVTDGQQMFVLQKQQNTFFTSACLQLIRTDYLRTNAIAFYEGILHEDNFFTVQAATYATRTGVCQKNLYLRRAREGSIMSSQITYKNLLGLYVTVLEYQKLLAIDTIRQSFREMLEKTSQEIISNNFYHKWLKLSEADKLLFFSSLSDTDRYTFTTVVLPLIVPPKVVHQKPAPKTSAMVVKPQLSTETMPLHRVVLRKAKTLCRLIRIGGPRHVVVALKEKRRILEEQNLK